MAVTDQYVYDGNQIVYVFHGDDEIANRQLWGPTVDQILADEQVHYNAGTTDYITDDLLWTLTDHLNTVRDLIDNDANVDNHLTYDSYGQVTSETNSSIDTLCLFTARPYDTDTFLQYNWRRWYDVLVAVWVTPDPIGFDGGDVNLRRYTHNSPVTAVDPTGLADAIEREQDDKGGTVVTINKDNTIVIMIGHGSKDKPHTFRFEGGQHQAAVFVGCDAGATNKSIPEANRVPNAKLSNGNIVASLVEPAGGKKKWRNYWKNEARKGAVELAKEWISKDGVKEVTVIQTKPATWADYFQSPSGWQRTITAEDLDSLKYDNLEPE